MPYVFFNLIYEANNNFLFISANLEAVGVAGSGPFSGYLVYSPPSNGSCLFVAIAHQLDRGMPACEEIRTELVDYIQSNANVLARKSHFCNCSRLCVQCHKHNLYNKLNMPACRFVNKCFSV